MSTKPSKCWYCAYLGNCPAKAPCEKFEPYPYDPPDKTKGKKLIVLKQKEAIKLLDISNWKYHILKQRNEGAIIDRLHELTGIFYKFINKGDRKVLVREDEDK